MNELEDRGTGRLRLRRLTSDDAATVLAIHIDPRTNAHRPGGAPSTADSEQVFQKFLRCWQDHGVGYWAVEFAGQVLGVAGVRPLRFRERECWNLYYRFAPKPRGRGLAAEAAREAVAVAETHRPIDPLARPGPDPPRQLGGRSVAQKTGLTRRSDLDSDGFLVLARGW